MCVCVCGGGGGGGNGSESSRTRVSHCEHYEYIFTNFDCNIRTMRLM